MISGTTSGAANILCVSQPAVSRLLSDFEATVGVEMFERHKKRLIATPEAKFFYAEVERAFVSLEHLSRAAEELRGFSMGSLRVASMPAMSVEFLPTLLRRFNDVHPGVSLSLQVRSTQQVADLVASQQFDVGVISGIQLSDPGIDMTTLADSRLVCVLPPGHRLAQHALIRPEDLEGEVFVSLGTEQDLRYKIDNVFEQAGVSRQLLIDTQLHYAACGFVLAGNGVSVVDPVTAQHYAKLGLVVKRFEPRIGYRYSLIFPRNRAQSVLTRGFVSLLQDELNALQHSSNGLFDML
ncbi:LysR family transcriptional regulator [Marinobacterium aestuarii]|uniref:LysR family transcriptional regulator n=2 Tax=Marinobacterium aestuarii TaxID=1821621 RepID=A0A1A9F5F3_9GAMM|nr:LysR family transcriptional regulator [Marinobacterium aestuarii]